MLSSGGSQGPSLRCLGAGDREGAAHTASPASGRSRAEDLGGARICSAAAARRPACPAGEILAPQRLGAATAGSSDHRDMQGRACRSRGEASTRPSARSTSPVDSGHRTCAQPSRAAQGATSFGRHSTATTLGPGSMPIRAPCRSRSYAPIAQISDTVEFRRGRRGLPGASRAPGCSALGQARHDGTMAAPLDNVRSFPHHI